MSERAKERTYTPEEIEARLKRDLPNWYLEDGWIRRKYRTNSWKGTLMVINTVGQSRTVGTGRTSPKNTTQTNTTPATAFHSYISDAMHSR